MSIQRNLNDSDIRKLLARIAKLEKAAPVNNAAIGRDGLLVYDGGVITIENGGLNVTGIATISGVLNVSGSTTLSGVTTIAGPTGITGHLTIQGQTDITGQLNVTGPTKLDGTTTIGGNTKVTGNLSIEGTSTLKGDLNVTTGGKIKAGNIEIRPDSGGQIAMLNGSLTSDSFGMGLVNTVGVQISSPNTKITDLPTKSATANLHVDSAGRLWKVA